MRRAVASRASAADQNHPVGALGDAIALGSLFVEKLTTAHASLRVLAQSELQFDAGTIGFIAHVAFAPMVGFDTAQVHVFRVDGGKLHHLVGTLSERDRLKSGAEVVAVLKSYRPN